MEDDNHTRGLDMSPVSVALIGIISATIVLVVYHCIATGWCRQRPTVPRPRQGQRSSSQQEETPCSSGNSMIQLIPAYRYTKETGLVVRTGDGTCAVCLCEFMEGEEVRILPECKHTFHVPCIDMWLYSHSNCPLCRTDTIIWQQYFRPPPVPPLPATHMLPDFGGQSRAT